VALVMSMLLLMKAIQTVPTGTSCAVWTGIGAFGTAIPGMIVFKDPVSFRRVFFIVTLISSIIGLKAVPH
jgi:quaternary ammonium compound-resistance protein SugE